MARYVRNIKIETEFDEQKIVAVMKPILLEDTIALRGDGDEAAVLRYARMLPRYIASMSTVFDADGVPVPIEEICASTFYIGLLQVLMTAHVDAANVPNPTSPVAA